MFVTAGIYLKVIKYHESALTVCKSEADWAKDNGCKTLQQLLGFVQLTDISD